MPTEYLDAKPDVENAIEYVYSLNKKKPIILLGSSYSSALALLISNKNGKNIVSKKQQ